MHKEEEPIPLSAAPQSPFKAPNATAEKAITLEPEADLGDTEISEQLSNSSAKWSACKQASPASAQYSEDFVSEDSEGSEANSFAEESLDGSEASLTSRRSDSSPGSFRQAPVQSANPVGTRKEAAVQTSPSSFAYHGLESKCVLGQDANPVLGKCPERAFMNVFQSLRQKALRQNRRCKKQNYKVPPPSATKERCTTKQEMRLHYGIQVGGREN